MQRTKVTSFSAMLRLTGSFQQSRTNARVWSLQVGRAIYRKAKVNTVKQTTDSCYLTRGNKPQFM